MLCLFGKDALQEKAPPHLRDALGRRASCLLQHMPGKALEAEYYAANESLALARHHGGEATLRTIRRMFGQEQHECASHRLLLHVRRHGRKTGIRLACACPP